MLQYLSKEKVKGDPPLPSPLVESRIVHAPVSILMPVCNEAEGIESVVAEMVEVVYRYLPEGSEFLIEEGGSTDGTREILDELHARWPFLSIVNSPHKEGFAAAARALYNRARCPLIFFVDSDGQCVASEFWKLAAEIDRCDCVLSAKRIHRDPFVRRMASRAFNSLARLYFKFDFRDINFGFRLVRREPALACLEACRHMPTLINSEMAILMHRGGFRIREVAVHHRPRLFGLSRGLAPASLGKESWGAFRALRKIRKEHFDPTQSLPTVRSPRVSEPRA